MDFAGSDPQVTGFVNSPMANTATCVYVAFLTTVTTPDIPHNEGVYRPVHITAPEGSRGEPALPGARWPPAPWTRPARSWRPAGWPCRKVLPERVPAGWNRWNGPTITGIDPRIERLLRHVRLQRLRRRRGHARHGRPALHRRRHRPGRPDRPEHRDQRERLPARHGVQRVHHRLLRRGQVARAAAGRSTASRCTTRTPTLVMFGDGKVHPPYGLFGGKPGSCNLAFINEGRAGRARAEGQGDRAAARRGTPTPAIPPAAAAGATPWSGTPRACARTRRDEIISPGQRAEKVYGVVLEGEELAVERADGRRRLRKSRRGG